MTSCHEVFFIEMQDNKVILNKNFCYFHLKTERKTLSCRIIAEQGHSWWFFLEGHSEILVLDISREEAKIG